MIGCRPDGNGLLGKAVKEQSASTRDTILLAGYEPHRKEPSAQRLSGVMEHRASSQRSLRIARFSHQHTARRHPRLPENPTTPENESVRPAQPPDVVTVIRLDPEPVVHFMECARVINAGDRSCISHGATVSMIFTWVKGIPILYEISLCGLSACWIWKQSA